jgi:hypothetical protein
MDSSSRDIVVVLGLPGVEKEDEDREGRSRPVSELDAESIIKITYE